MAAQINRRALTTGILAATAAPAIAHNAGSAGISLRGDDTFPPARPRCVFWARLPLSVLPDGCVAHAVARHTGRDRRRGARHGLGELRLW